MNDQNLTAEAPVHTTIIHKNSGFNLQCSEHTDNMVMTYSRKDFYKVCLYFGECNIDYADKGIRASGATLFFGTPHIPYAWENINKIKAYSCIFTEDFLKTNNNSISLQQSPLFKIGGSPIFMLNDEQQNTIADIFEKMIEAHNTNYLYKDDLLRNFLNLIIHQALQMQPTESYSTHQNASSRVTSLFLELLERQFPIESPATPLNLRNPNDFASNLAVHVNHLNRAVKNVTGKPTKTHITERIMTEAKALLRHTDWSIADIAYSLGFEYTTYFNNFFRKHADTTPTAYRSDS